MYRAALASARNVAALQGCTGNAGRGVASGLAVHPTGGIPPFTASAVVAAAALAAALTATAAGRPKQQQRWGSGLETRAEEAQTSFDAWAESLLASSPEIAEEVPCIDLASRTRERSGSVGFIFQTLFGKGKIERIRMWRCQPPAPPPEGLGVDEVPGVTELWVLLELGDELCGHPEFIHGGFLSALFDELFGWCAGMEREALGEKSAKIFTANLDVNYRRPVPKSSSYLVKCRVEKVVRQKKVYTSGSLFSSSGLLLTESTSLYVLTGLSQASRNRTAADRLPAPAAPVAPV
mmetsp:Transcript_91470/g.295987  ORF Transcript_91470/g.295987 Transcript_91470/m.295987 type:complete len:293 (+) Transcript_91470:80-958(+)